MSEKTARNQVSMLFDRLGVESRAMAIVVARVNGVAVTLQREHIVFYDLPTSPFCIKVRALLHRKGLSFNAVNPLQARHWLALQRRSLGKVPALQIDGRWVSDSTDIAYELDRLYPHTPLVPVGARGRPCSGLVPRHRRMGRRVFVLCRAALFVERPATRRRRATGVW